MSILNDVKKAYEKNKTEVMTLEQYLKLLETDKSVAATPAERMLTAIGEPLMVDTSKDTKLRKIFGDRLIRTYPTFNDFYGMEEVVDRIVSFFKHAAQGLEESRQILYLLGPVGSAKSSLAERLKKLMESQPIYVLTDSDGKMSPVFESPLGIMPTDYRENLGLANELVQMLPSPWATKRIDEYEGDLSKFKVTKVYPSRNKQIGICKTEPGDDNNQDISALVGKLDIRKLEHYAQDDPDAYRYSGGLCLANQGMLEFVEMFKAPIKILHPLLTATQEHNYKGTEALAAIPFNGIIVAHSNESEWDAFKSNKSNEAFLDRVYVVKVPYCLRKSEEMKIYKKFIKSSSLRDAPCAPHTLDILAEFVISSRLDADSSAEAATKVQVYDGVDMKKSNIDCRSYQEYRDLAFKNNAQEGFDGVSTRTAYKIIADVANFDEVEIALDPIHMMYIIEKNISQDAPSREALENMLGYLNQHIAKEYAKKVGRDIQTAYLDSYHEFGQSLFDRYIVFADKWCQDEDFRDPDTGVMYNRAALDEELTGLEKPARISNPKDFRNEVVNFSLRYQAQNKGKNPDWKSYEKLKAVIEQTMFDKTKDLLPVISFNGSGNKEDKAKHKAFVDRMVEMGYTERQVQRVVDWHLRVSRQ
jgi:serine protein kinase